MLSVPVLLVALLHLSSAYQDLGVFRVFHSKNDLKTAADAAKECEQNGFVLAQVRDVEELEELRLALAQLELPVTTELWIGDNTPKKHHSKLSDAQLPDISGNTNRIVSNWPNQDEVWNIYAKNGDGKRMYICQTLSSISLNNQYGDFRVFADTKKSADKAAEHCANLKPGNYELATIRNAAELDAARTTMAQVNLPVTTELWLGDKTPVGHHGKVADADLDITSGDSNRIISNWPNQREKWNVYAKQGGERAFICQERVEIAVEPAIEPVEPAIEPVEPAIEPVEPAVEPVEPAIEPPAAPAKPPIETPADEDCEKQRERFKENKLPIVEPAFVDDCRFVLKQCNSKQCWCVKAKSGDLAFKKEEDFDGVPLEEDYDCSSPPKNCQKDRFNRKLKNLKAWAPECAEDGRYALKQCKDGECWCAKPRQGKEFGDRAPSKDELKCE